MKKLLAFTITEVVVTMLLSAIVVGITWSLLSIVQKEFNVQESEMHISWKTGELHSLLNKDIFSAGPVCFNNDTLVCHFSAYEVYYLFRSKEVVRWSSYGTGNPDIFPFPVKEVSPMFTINHSEDHNIRYLTILLGGGGDSLRMSFLKSYEPDSLVTENYED